MVAVAIYAADGPRRGRLEHLLRKETTTIIVGASGDLSAVARLIDKTHADVVLADSPPVDQLTEWRARHNATAFIVMVDDPSEDGLGALYAGADAILPRSADDRDIAAAIQAVKSGLAVMSRHLLETLIGAGSPDVPRRNAGEAHAPLTPRELEVLASMADGASNKTIARRLGISFHTVKFHVAAILVKLDADSRTEAVAKAAHLGLVML